MLLINIMIINSIIDVTNGLCILSLSVCLCLFETIESLGLANMKSSCIKI